LISVCGIQRGKIFGSQGEPFDVAVIFWNCWLTTAHGSTDGELEAA
jgi:hypothetical protein